MHLNLFHMEAEQNRKLYKEVIIHIYKEQILNSNNPLLMYYDIWYKTWYKNDLNYIRRTPFTLHNLESCYIILKIKEIYMQSEGIMPMGINYFVFVWRLLFIHHAGCRLYKIVLLLFMCHYLDTFMHSTAKS